ncbi:helix-turn-helix domain-containing protein [Stappia sp. 22II-S9-Z10]|nr:helix-turn-helix domain-containing protein [Stappia sp. 22II-S9-Z10]
MYRWPMTPAQCRAARGLLDWTQQALADASQVGNATIRNFEAGRSTPQRATLTVLRQAFEAAGVEFIPENGGGAGVRLKRAP